MAKKSTGVWDKRPPGRPSRQCEKCEKFYFPRYKVCPNCGAANPSMTGGKRRKVTRRVRSSVRSSGVRRKTGPGSRRINALDAAIDFVRAAGGMDQARSALDTIDRIRRL